MFGVLCWIYNNSSGAATYIVLCLHGWLLSSVCRFSPDVEKSFVKQCRRNLVVNDIYCSFEYQSRKTLNEETT